MQAATIVVGVGPRFSSSFTADWLRRESFGVHPRLVSSPSLASDGSGSRIVRKRRVLHCHTVSSCMNRMNPVSNKGKRRASSSNKLDLMGRRASRTIDVSSNRNEDWDDSSMMRSSCKVKVPNLFALAPELTLKHRPGKKTVRFGEPQVMPLCTLGPSDDVLDVHHQRSDYARFLEDGLSCARAVRRVMKYASTCESSYNSSIGLPSPAALADYLSSPQEVAGIEHLLDGQDLARASLRRHHARRMAEEQERQRGEGRDDPTALAERLGDGSRIAEHMARGRAAYIALLD